MTLYSVNYVFNMSNEYAALHDRLESYPHQYVMDSHWLIESTQTAQELSDSLVPFIGSSDSLVVSEVGANWAGFGTESTPPSAHQPS